MDIIGIWKVLTMLINKDNDIRRNKIMKIFNAKLFWKHTEVLSVDIFLDVWPSSSSNIWYDTGSIYI